jgi:hypothetical protein
MGQTHRTVLIGIGVGVLLLALGFRMHADWALLAWPVPSSPLSDIFVASIFAAIGGPLIWIAATNEEAAIVSGSADLLVVNAGLSATSFWFWSTTGNAKLLGFGLFTLLMTAVCALLCRKLRRVPFKNRQPMPVLVRVAFGAFALLLAIAAFRLILIWPNTFPWPLGPETSMFYGFIFLGAMVYFLYGLLFPVWGNAGGQLVGFLLYDLVLIGPFVRHFAKVAPEMLPSLTIYVSVLIASGLIALWFLFIHPATRFGAAAATSRVG